MKSSPGYRNLLPNFAATFPMPHDEKLEMDMLDCPAFLPCSFLFEETS